MAFLQGDCGDPGACFGMRAVPGQGLAVRAFLPRAGAGGAGGRRHRPDGRGRCAWSTPKGCSRPACRNGTGPSPTASGSTAGASPRSWTTRTGSAPILGELDVYLMAEGTHLRLYEKLGAHPAAQDGVAGVEFAVWAPDARRVSVVGQFNNWDGRRHLMRRFRATGVWELFIPGLAPGDLYKFELKSRDGRLLPLKADPFAFRCEHAPRHRLGGGAGPRPRLGRPALDGRALAAQPLRRAHQHLRGAPGLLAPRARTAASWATGSWPTS